MGDAGSGNYDVLGDIVDGDQGATVTGTIESTGSLDIDMPKNNREKNTAMDEGDYVWARGATDDPNRLTIRTDSSSKKKSLPDDSEKKTPPSSSTGHKEQIDRRGTRESEAKVPPANAEFGDKGKNAWEEDEEKKKKSKKRKMVIILIATIVAVLAILITAIAVIIVFTGQEYKGAILKLRDTI